MVRDVMGHVTGLFCLLQLALTKTEVEEGSDDIKPARSSSLCVGVSPRSCQHRGNGYVVFSFYIAASKQTLPPPSPTAS